MSRGKLEQRVSRAAEAALAEQRYVSSRPALRSSGRIGRSAAGRALEPDAVRLAVTASVRHLDTDYDDLLMSGVNREDARTRVWDRVEAVLSGWRVASA